MPYPIFDEFVTEVAGVAQCLADQFDASSVSLNEWLSKQHKSDGSHGNMTADTITVGVTSSVVVSTLGNLMVGGGGTFTTARFTVRADLGWIANVAATSQPADLDLSADATFQSRIRFIETGTSPVLGWELGHNITVTDRSFDLYNLTNNQTVLHATEAGAVTVPFTLSVTGNFAINTNKLTVNATNGDTVIGGGGTLTVPGVINVNGDLLFPATQVASANPNALDDYEEGTWTPADGSGAGLSLTVSGATYCKIGQQVVAAFNIVFPVTASGASAAISGLPFTIRTSGQTATVAAGYSTFGAGIEAYGADAGTIVYLYNVSGVALTNLQLSGATLSVTIPYRATA